MKRTHLTLLLLPVLLAGCGEPATDTAPTPSPASSSAQSVASAPAAQQTWTMAQIQEHANEESCFTVINGNVYDVTSFINVHKGGAEKVLATCGKDGTALYDRKHAGQEKPAAVLETFKIGTLQ